MAVLFHGVAPRRADPRIERSHHEADSFRAIAKSLKAHFHILPLAALDDALAHPVRHARTLFLMSDDGYRNTSTVAADILEELQLPWTLFISTHHVDTGEPNPLMLARLFLYYAPAGTYAIPHLEAPLTLGVEPERDRLATHVIASLKALEIGRAREAIAAMAGVFADDRFAELIARFPAERFLGWDDVARLHKRGVEIGAHAHRHWPMNAAQSAENLREQARLPKEMIEAQIGPCPYFAYPFGNVGDVSARAWQDVRDAGYRYAFTTLSASLDAGANPWLLPRYTLRPSEPHLRALLPLMRAGNARLSRWQERLAD